MSLTSKIASWFGKGDGKGEEAAPQSSPDEPVEATAPVEDMPESPVATAAPSPGGDTLFECASVPDSGPRCQELIELGADPLERDTDGRTPIHAAALHGNLSALEALCEHAVGVDPLDNFRVSPLLYALRTGDPQAAKAAAFLLEKGARVTLNVAYCMGDLHLINHLHTGNRNAFKQCKSPDELLTDLVNAIRRKCDEKVAASGSGGDDAKIEAIEAGVLEPYLPIIIRTIDMGCHADAFDTAGRPALFEAIRFRSTDLAETLLKHGADPEFETEDGDTPLKAAAGNEKVEALLRSFCAEE